MFGSRGYIDGMERLAWGDARQIAKMMDGTRAEKGLVIMHIEYTLRLGMSTLIISGQLGESVRLFVKLTKNKLKNSEKHIKRY